MQMVVRNIKYRFTLKRHFIYVIIIETTDTVVESAF